MITLSIIQKSQLKWGKRLDAEYYQPEYLAFERRLYTTGLYKTWESITGKFITGPFGSEFNVENYIPNGKYRYVRGKDVKDFFLQHDDNVYLPEKDFERLKKYALQDGDILISVVGTPGYATIVDSSILPAIFSCKSTAFRTNSIDPYYFIAYLNSKYGQAFLQRSIRGALQTGLNIDDLRNLPVFIPITQKQKVISQIVKDAKNAIEASDDFYLQAENLLLAELGLTNFEKDQSLSWDTNLSDIKTVHRMDAEYFQPKYEKLISEIKKQKAERLDNLVIIKKGFEPGSDAYQEQGRLFIRVSSLSRNDIENQDQKYLSEALYQELKKNFEPKVGEILLTKDATPGIAYYIKEPVVGIVSGGILRLKLKEKIDPEYLTLCINSIIGKMQVERDAGGSIIIHWRPEQIKNLEVPILPKAIQQKIAGLVQRSHEARQKSKELLEQAKHKVEELIENQK